MSTWTLILYRLGDQCYTLTVRLNFSLLYVKSSGKLIIDIHVKCNVYSNYVLFFKWYLNSLYLYLGYSYKTT